jgi:hypothetical protein
MKQVLDTIWRYLAPAALIMAGGAILYAQATEVNWLGYIWPLFIMLPGLPFLYMAWTAEEPSRVRMIFPGGIITGTGVILLYQLITTHWHSWTYAWALYPVFFGLGLIFQGRRLNIKTDVRMGRWMLVGGLSAFFILWLLFETIVFSGQYQGIMGYLLASVLIGSGVIWGINKFRVARLLAASQVLHMPPTGHELRPINPENPQETLVPRQNDVQAQLEARRQQANLSPSTTVEAIPAEVTSLADSHQAQDDQPIITPPENPIADEELLTEYRPPKIGLGDDAPKADIDPDLQAKINAALNNSDE